MEVLAWKAVQEKDGSIKLEMEWAGVSGKRGAREQVGDHAAPRGGFEGSGPGRVLSWAEFYTLWTTRLPLPTPQLARLFSVYSKNSETREEKFCPKQVNRDS